MKERREFEGRIFCHGDGLGNVTPELIEARAKEIAVIDGRKRATNADRIQARRELLGSHESSDNWEDLDEDVDLESLDPSDIYASHGERHECDGGDDESMIAEHLVEEGVDEADHEHMLEGHLVAEDEDEEDEEKP